MMGIIVGLESSLLNGYRNGISDDELSKYHYFELNMLLYRYKVSTAME